MREVEIRKKRIAKLDEQIQALREQMKRMLAGELTPEQNLDHVGEMEHMREEAGEIENEMHFLEIEIEIIEGAGEDRRRRNRGLAAAKKVRRIEVALDRRRRRRRRHTQAGHTHVEDTPDPLEDKLVKKLAEAQRELVGFVVTPSSGAPGGGAVLPPPNPDDPVPAQGQPAGVFVLTCDPRDLKKHPGYQAEVEAYSARVPHGSPATPDELPPTFSVYRDFRVPVVTMPDGNPVEFWTFHAVGEAANTWPGSLIRVPQGALFHGTMKPRKGTHTIHWHGIEPTAMNDGVGKLSFEVDSQYTYQWQATEPGLYFYHCHHNTVLHFELGMYGGLIVDPKPPAGDPLEVGFNQPTEPAGYPTGGPGYTLRANGAAINPYSQALQRYDVEGIWVVDDVDPRWRQMSHDDGIGLPWGPDVGLNVFEPKYFCLSGSFQGPTGFCQTAQVRAGQTLLLRIICASYTTQSNVFRPATAADAGLNVPAAPMTGQMIAFDARTLGHPPFVQYASEIPIAPNEKWYWTAARRCEIIFQPGDEHVGDHIYRAEFHRYVSNDGDVGPKFVGSQGVDHASALIRVLPRA
jgi:hypothetical protein